MDDASEPSSAPAPPVHVSHHNDTNASFVPRFSADPSGRSLTSTTARLWQLRRAATSAAASSTAAPATVPSINNQSQLYPRHPRFESMDKQLASMLHALSHHASQRPYLLPTDSALSILLPLKASPLVYDQYVRFDGGVRFGKVLEDLDAFAANIAHMHLLLGSSKRDGAGEAAYLPPGEVMLVTATVDSIVLQRRFPMEHDVLMRGRVAWVGTSSLEVNITMSAIVERQHGATTADSGTQLQRELQQESAGTTADRWEKPPMQQEVEFEVGAAALDFGALPPAGTYSEEKILDAVFLMVARNAKTNKAAAVCPLAVDEMSEEDRRAFEQGERNKERRKQNMAQSLTRAPPTTDEVALLHQVLMKDSAAAAAKPNAAIAPAIPTATMPHNSAPTTSAYPSFIRAKSCSMRSTEMRSSDMTQPQERNTNGKIFGGSLMRRAYELARTTAYVFAGPNAHPYLVASDTITFLRPVEIGSVIEFGSKVVYSGGWPDRYFQVKVETHIRDLVSGQQFVSNTFQFTFECDAVPVRRVEPELYSEAMEWLEGRRLVVQLEERNGNANGRAQRVVAGRTGGAVSIGAGRGVDESSGGQAVKRPGGSFAPEAREDTD